VSDAAELIWITFGGRTFKCSRRTAAHLLWTAARLERLHPDARIVVFQGSYNTGVEASAGTHDLDAVLDVQIVGLDWYDAQRFLRECGWAAWVREPPTFTWHIHMVSLGYPGDVGVYVPGQVSDYYAHRSGLAGHLPDPTWHPADIDATVFNYPRWVEQEDERDMAEYGQRILDRLNAIAAAERDRDKRRFDLLMAALASVADDTEADAATIRARLKTLRQEVAALAEDEPVEP